MAAQHASLTSDRASPAPPAKAPASPILPRLDDADGAIAPQILRALREAIVRGDLRPGAVLSEADVARRFGVSRQPVRESFIKLQEAGLLSIRPQRGTVVQRISIDAVFGARFVREAVEAAVVRIAAETRPAGLVPRLVALIAAQERVAAVGDSPGFLQLDEAFHRAMADGIGRSFAWTALEGIKAQMDRVRFLSFEGATPLAELIRQHSAIVDGIAAGDAARAEAALRAHLREILSSLPRIAEAHPDYFEPATPGRNEPPKEETP